MDGILDCMKITCNYHFVSIFHPLPYHDNVRTYMFT